MAIKDGGYSGDFPDHDLVWTFQYYDSFGLDCASLLPNIILQFHLLFPAKLCHFQISNRFVGAIYEDATVLLSFQKIAEAEALHVVVTVSDRDAIQKGRNLFVFEQGYVEVGRIAIAVGPEEANVANDLSLAACVFVENFVGDQFNYLVVIFQKRVVWIPPSCCGKAVFFGLSFCQNEQVAIVQGLHKILGLICLQNPGLKACEQGRNDSVLALKLQIAGQTFPRGRLLMHIFKHKFSQRTIGFFVQINAHHFGVFAKCCPRIDVRMRTFFIPINLQ